MGKMNLIAAPELEIDARMIKSYGRKVSRRGRLERRIVANLIAHLDARGFQITDVWDGESTTPVRGDDRMRQAMELIFNLDECHLYFDQQWVFLVLGNGEDIVSDYTCGNKDFDEAMGAFDTEEID